MIKNNIRQITIIWKLNISNIYAGIHELIKDKGHFLGIYHNSTFGIKCVIITKEIYVTLNWLICLTATPNVSIIILEQSTILSNVSDPSWNCKNNWTMIFTFKVDPTGRVTKGACIRFHSSIFLIFILHIQVKVKFTNHNFVTNHILNG